MPNEKCELCGLYPAQLSILNGEPIYLCEECEAEIGRIGRHSPAIFDPYQGDAGTDDNDQSWQDLGPKKDHRANFDW